MKPGQNAGKQRSRGRSNNGAGGKGRMPSRNQTYDSNGPDIRIRGNAHQVLEKYLAMARDASAQGDRIAAENYYQHAEHYFRVINNQAQHNGNRPVQRPLVTPADDHALLSGDLDDEGDENDSSVIEDEVENDGDVEVVAESEAEAEAEVIVRGAEVIAAEPQPAPVAEEEPVVVKRRRGPRRPSVDPAEAVNA